MSTKIQFFRLIDGTNVFGESTAIQTENGSEIQIKQPWTAKAGNVMPYMVDDMTSAPGAIQIHPINVLWSVPLDEFPEAYEMYKKQTSPIITQTQKIIC